MVYAPVGEPARFSRLSQNENARLQALCGHSSVKENPVDRLAGGYKTFKGQYPWAVSMVWENKKNRCGGALISDRHILSAVHCFYKYDAATVPCT
ncbi:trypsin domain-containing protein [Ditylenchus destructor]|nr:trypsin domain-containing protein [Ditylenchus destructor]